MTLNHEKPRSSRYIDEFIQLNCASTLLTKPVYPNTKEITEAMSAWHAVNRVIDPSLRGESNVWCFDVAAGSSPRVGALFACMSKWQVVSIDPQLGSNPNGGQYQTKSYPIRRLKQVPKRIEDVNYKVTGKAIITAVHAHCSLQNILDSIKAEKRILVAMPCCKDLVLDQEPDIQYRDEFNWSPEDKIKIWDNI